MRVGAALLVILSMGAAVARLAGDLLSSTVYATLAVLDGVLIWLVTDINQGENQ